MNRTKIEWCDYTWNPVVGCKTGCPHCYARRINDRFHIIDKWDEPEFFPNRIEQPGLVNRPSKIFVVSMGDLFGDWIKSTWIHHIIESTFMYPQHEYMFLTKYPQRYRGFSFPSNCWLGATVETKHGQLRLDYLELYDNSQVKKYISAEPLLGDFNGVNLSFLDLVIVGAMTGPGAIKPQSEWINSIKHNNIFYKDNIIPYLT